MVTDDRSRGQVILIGAIALAFIILGVVVVFNGILYTETLSSGQSSHGAADAATVDLEITQGVGCLLYYTGEDDVDNITDEFDSFAQQYQRSTANSHSSIIDVSEDGGDVVVTYESRDVSYTRTLEVTAADCPESDESTE